MKKVTQREMPLIFSHDKDKDSGSEDEKESGSASGSRAPTPSQYTQGNISIFGKGENELGKFVMTGRLDLGNGCLVCEIGRAHV